MSLMLLDWNLRFSQSSRLTAADSLHAQIAVVTFILRALRMQLRAAGFKVLVFDRWRQLEARILKANACILLDVFMPPDGKDRLR